MATPNYYVQSSVSRPDAATFTDRETGEQDAAVDVTKETDGATDARYQTTLIVDVEVPDGVYLVVNVNGSQATEMGL